MARLTTREVSRVLPLDLPWWINKENCYRASHYGLEADFIYDQQGRCRPLRGLIEELIEICEPVADDIGETGMPELARKLLADGPGYLQQLEVYAETESAQAVTAYLTSRLCGKSQLAEAS
jgi:carboxylate-amine ligase